jgi:hypothetical protein
VVDEMKLGFILRVLIHHEEGMRFFEALIWQMASIR